MLAIGTASAIHPDTIDNKGIGKTQLVDSLSTNAIDSASTLVQENDLSETARIVDSEDGESYLLFKGQAYTLSDIVERQNPTSKEASEDVVNQRFRELGTLGILGILAICFGFPALVIIVAIILIIGFFTRRNRERNALISQAIDRNYQLPDSFYSKLHDESGAEAETVVERHRDPKQFGSAITLLAVGLCLSVYFWAIDAPFGCIAGGIPLLLGVGRLIGYFYVPEYGTKPYDRHREGLDAADGRKGAACPPPPPAEKFYYDPRDPRYNGNRRL